jgi:sugar phosphate isomerase/epimerase
MPVEEAVASIGKLGFKYAELMTTPPHIWIRGMDKSARAKLRQVFAQNNIELMAVNPTFLDINLVSQNIGLRQESIAQIKETFEFAGELGAKLAVIMLGKRHTLIPAPYEKTWDLAKEAILQCLEYARQYNVIFALENATGNFMTSASEAIKMAAEINEPYFKIIYDTANGFFMNEDPVQGLTEAAPYLAHVHISDTTKKTWGHQAIGAGQVDFAAIAETLKKINYQGVTIFELTDGTVNPDEMYRAGYEQLAKLGWSK